jgi:hypothetical protein
MAIHIRRREFIATLGVVAAACPLAVRAQHPERMRRSLGWLRLFVDCLLTEQDCLGLFRHDRPASEPFTPNSPTFSGAWSLVDL